MQDPGELPWPGETQERAADPVRPGVSGPEVSGIGGVDQGVVNGIGHAAVAVAQRDVPQTGDTVQATWLSA